MPWPVQLLPDEPRPQFSTFNSWNAAAEIMLCLLESGQELAGNAGALTVIAVLAVVRNDLHGRCGRLCLRRGLSQSTAALFCLVPR